MKKIFNFKTKIIPKIKNNLVSLNIKTLVQNKKVFSLPFVATGLFLGSSLFIENQTQCMVDRTQSYIDENETTWVRIADRGIFASVDPVPEFIMNDSKFYRMASYILSSISFASIFNMVFQVVNNPIFALYNWKAYFFAISSVLSMIGSIMSFNHPTIPFDNTLTIEEKIHKRREIIEQKTVEQMIERFGWEELNELTTPLELRGRLANELIGFLKQSNPKIFFEKYEKSFRQFLDNGIFIPAEIELLRDIKKFDEKLNSLDRFINVNDTKTFNLDEINKDQQVGKKNQEQINKLLKIKKEIEDETLYCYSIFFQEIYPRNNFHIMDTNSVNYPQKHLEEIITNREGRRKDSQISRKIIKQLNLFNIEDPASSNMVQDILVERKKRDEYDDGLPEFLKPTKSFPNPLKRATNSIKSKYLDLRAAFWNKVDGFLTYYTDFLQPHDIHKQFDETIDDSNLRLHRNMATLDVDDTFLKGKSADALFPQKDPFFKENLFPEETDPNYTPQYKQNRMAETNHGKVHRYLEEFMALDEYLEQNDIEAYKDQDNYKKFIQPHIQRFQNEIFMEKVDRRPKEKIQYEDVYKYKHFYKDIVRFSRKDFERRYTLKNLPYFNNRHRKIARGEYYSYLALDEKQLGPSVIPEGSYILHKPFNFQKFGIYFNLMLDLANYRSRFQDQKKMFERINQQGKVAYFPSRSKKERVEYVKNFMSQI
eukprot:TRINITY_DN8445_c0_g1_i1.p1 TRINITY_DN8445_c0_g1~~TRINITY_DN8445_c0_g1_i1.p1  ORF type:complete len:710 (+),score=194.24 TRINITY_DN8445_c0_g1_i1:1-2130(+)